MLVWPAKQAPLYKYGWQSALAILVLVILMTCILRFIDLRYLMPKREAFAAVLHGEDADGNVVKVLSSEASLDKKSADDEVAVKQVPV